MRDAIAPSGLEPADLARTAWRAYSFAVGGDGAQVPDEMPGDDADLWLAVAHWGLRVFEENRDADDAGTFADLTRRMYATVCAASNEPAPVPLDDRRPYMRVALEAACRHLFGAISCDKDDLDSAGEREASWAAWARDRLAKLEPAAVR